MARRKCSFTTKSGRPCRAWAVRDTDPPACSAHAGRTAGAGAPPRNDNAQKHGFYSPTLQDQELADLVAFGGDLSLDDEIALCRVTLRRLAQTIADDGNLLAADHARLASLLFAGSRTVARLLRDKRTISGEAADNLLGAIGTALDELGAEMGWSVEL